MMSGLSSTNKHNMHYYVFVLFAYIHLNQKIMLIQCTIIKADIITIVIDYLIINNKHNLFNATKIKLLHKFRLQFL